MLDEFPLLHQRAENGLATNEVGEIGEDLHFLCASRFAPEELGHHLSDKGHMASVIRGRGRHRPHEEETRNDDGDCRRQG
jgi:hypothetical protein